MSTIRWNLAVSTEIDQSLRMFLASHGGKKEDLSRFVEDAVRARILELTTEQAKFANEDFSESELTFMVEEAIQWARENK